MLDDASLSHFNYFLTFGMLQPTRKHMGPTPHASGDCLRLLTPDTEARQQKDNEGCNGTVQIIRAQVQKQSLKRSNSQT
jgi:hypothetical protein